MRSNKILLDSDVIISFLRNQEAAVRLLTSSDDKIYYTTILNRFEVLNGMKNHERKETLDILDAFVTIPLYGSIFRLAEHLLMENRCKGISITDFIIAATAMVHECTLVTNNLKHYPIAGLKVQTC